MLRFFLFELTLYQTNQLFKIIASLSSGTGIEMTMRRLVEKEEQYVLVPPLGEFRENWVSYLYNIT
jgi:hypothetical protein